jgi:hypothetical protein
MRARGIPCAERLVQCHFISSRVSITTDPRKRSTVRNMRFIDCEQIGCTLETAIVEDVLEDGFETNGLFQSWAAVFKHVTLRGRIGSIMISPVVQTGTATPPATATTSILYLTPLLRSLDLGPELIMHPPVFLYPGCIMCRIYTGGCDDVGIA